MDNTTPVRVLVKGTLGVFSLDWATCQNVRKIAVCELADWLVAKLRHEEFELDAN